MKLNWRAYLHLGFEKQILIGAGVLALIPLGLNFFRPSETAPVEAAGIESTDTHIPAGFVLVPIEARNSEALDSIFGRFGTVDLYQGDALTGAKQRLVARNVRMLRAPQNPSHFAVLIPESQTEAVLGEAGPFTVTVKRPGQDGTEFVKPTLRANRKRSISYGGE